MIEIKRSGDKITLVDQGAFSQRLNSVYVRMSRFGLHPGCMSDRAIVKRSGFAVLAKCVGCGKELMREPKIVITQNQLILEPSSEETGNVERLSPQVRHIGAEPALELTSLS